jgi:SAM-dependent MidA family methyltransferase
MTVADFMDLALYDPELGYYARAGRRSGRAGDFFTSVDVGPLFGELLAVQIAEMAQLMRTSRAGHSAVLASPNDLTVDSGFDLVEAGAGDGRLSADILRALREQDADCYEHIRLHLVEASAAARAQQRATLERGGLIRAINLSSRLVSSGASLPDSFEGVLIANELLDALPVHQVVMRDAGLREVFVSVSAGDLRLVEGPPSTPALQQYLDRLDVRLKPGWRVEINLRAVEWIRDAARRLPRGFIVLIDYGHEARDLYSVSHSSGTLTTFSRHTSRGPEHSGGPPWLANPGAQDITAHVDFTSIRLAAEEAGLTTIALLDQTYFLLGIVAARERDAPRASHYTAARAAALKTLVMPGGLGSTLKVLILGRDVGVPVLRGCSFKVRMT